MGAQQIEALQRHHRLTRLESQAFQLSGTTLYRWRFAGSRSVATVVRELGPIVSWPGHSRITCSCCSKTQPGPKATRRNMGDNVLVAVIDSAIDGNHPELAGSIAGTFDALSTTATPHQHGTAIASLIAAHGRLMGSAPDAKIRVPSIRKMPARKAPHSTFSSRSIGQRRRARA